MCCLSPALVPTGQGVLFIALSAASRTTSSAWQVLNKYGSNQYSQEDLTKNAPTHVPFDQFGCDKYGYFNVPLEIPPDLEFLDMSRPLTARQSLCFEDRC